MIPRWELLNPEGVVNIAPMKLNRHPQTLEGKTVLLRWNGKHNGDLLLNRVAALLAEQVKGIRILKAWEVAPESIEAISGSQEKSTSLMTELAAHKPDIVIGSQGD